MVDTNLYTKMLFITTSSKVIMLSMLVYHISSILTRAVTPLVSLSLSCFIIGTNLLQPTVFSTSTRSAMLLKLFPRETDAPTLCGLGCQITFNFSSLDSTRTYSLKTLKISYLQLAGYTITQAVTYKAYNIDGDTCITTTTSTNLDEPYTIPLDTTASGLALGAVVGSDAPQPSGLANCSAKAVQLSVSVSTLGFAPASTLKANLGSAPSIARSPSVPPSILSAQNQLLWQGKVALGVMMPLIVLGSIAAFLGWIRRKRRLARD